MEPERIRVLRIINRFNLGGPTYNAAYLTRYLPNDFETKLIGGSHLPDEESSLFICENLGLNPIIIPELSRAVNPKNDFKAYKAIKKIIAEFKPHIVHTHASKAGALGRRAAFKLKVPIVVHTFHGHVFHSYFGRFKTALYKNIERKLAKKSDAVIAISQIQKNELTNIYKIVDKNKTHVIPLGFDLKRFSENIAENRKLFREKYGINDNEIVIGIVGRLVPIKNHTLFIEAISPLLKKHGNKIRIVITGDGTERENIINLIKAKDISWVYNPQQKSDARIILTSWIKNAELVHAGSDIICLSSFNEGTPVSLIEAQAAGRPVLSTRIGGVEDVVLENETGFLINVDDKNTFTQKLEILITNEELRNSMGKKGPAWVLNRYDYQALVTNVSNLYRKLLNNKSIV